MTGLARREKRQRETTAATPRAGSTDSKRGRRKASSGVRKGVPGVSEAVRMLSGDSRTVLGE